MENVMGISSKTASSLGELQKLSPEESQSMSHVFLKSLISGTAPPEMSVSDEHEPLLRGISTLLLEAGKNRCSVELLAASLKEVGIEPTEPTMRSLLDLYATHRDTIVAHMEATGIASPALVDISWRLDYSVRSKHGGRENLPMYFVTLKVKDRGITRDIEIIASLEELQDLHGRVREAVAAAPKVAI